jgi:hypothetical protein
MVHDLLRLLFDKRIVFLLEMFCEDGHGGGGNMKGTEGSPERLESRDNFRVLAVSAIMEIGKGHHLDQVEESRGLFASNFTQAAIQFTANRTELFTKPTLLVFAAGVQI